MNKELCPKCHGSGNQVVVATWWKVIRNMFSEQEPRNLETCSRCKGRGTT